MLGDVVGPQVVLPFRHVRAQRTRERFHFAAVERHVGPQSALVFERAAAGGARHFGSFRIWKQQSEYRVTLPPVLKKTLVSTIHFITTTLQILTVDA